MTAGSTTLHEDSDQVAWVGLAARPTPLQHMPRLGAAIGLRNLWIKRDDCTGLGAGGTKARALEYLMAEALGEGVDTVLTYGGYQSNHTALTAAAAARLGLRSVLFQTGAPPRSAQGSHVVSRLCGAEIVDVPEASPHQVQLLMHRRAEALRASGRRPLLIPLGGATPTSCVGYVRAAEELASQLKKAGIIADAIVVAAGSGGALAGLTLGARRYLKNVAVTGFSVGPTADMLRRRCARLIADIASRLGANWTAPLPEVLVSDAWVGEGYGKPSSAAWEVVDIAARTEGLLLEPIYTGKALAGLRSLAATARLEKDANVIFWHTGGLPALFALDRTVS